MPKDRIGLFARAALKQALGVVTGDRRLEGEGAAEKAAAQAGRGAGRSPAVKRDAR